MFAMVEGEGSEAERKLWDEEEKFQDQTDFFKA